MPYKDKEKLRAYMKEYYELNKTEQLKKAHERYIENSAAVKDRAKIRREVHREEIKKQRHEYYVKNKNKIVESQREWAKNNRSKIRAIKDTYKKAHREKILEKASKYAKDNRSKHNTLRKIRRSNKDYTKNEKLRDTYGISLEDFQALLALQGHKCGICDKDFIEEGPNNPKYPCIDHCHTSGKVRGVLCRKCNAGIGELRDRVSLLSRAIEWLKGGTKFHRDSLFNPDGLMPIGPRKQALKRIFGLTIDQYKELLINQNGQCGICEKPFTSNKRRSESAAVDHQHDEEGKIRGLLCGHCNRALGLLDDNTGIMKNAIDWLKKTG